MALINILSCGGRYGETVSKSDMAYEELVTLLALLRTKGGKAYMDKNLFKGKKGLQDPETVWEAVSDFQEQWSSAQATVKGKPLTGKPVPVGFFEKLFNKERKTMNRLAQAADLHLQPG